MRSVRLGYEEKVDFPSRKLFSARVVEPGRVRFDWIFPIVPENDFSGACELDAVRGVRFPDGNYSSSEKRRL